MLTQELKYTVNHTNLSPDIANSIVKVVSEEIDQYYKLSGDLHKILGDALFDKGAHIRLVLPESAVDELINDRPNMRFESVDDIKALFKAKNITTTGVLGPYKSQNSSGMRFERLGANNAFDDAIYLGDKKLPNVEITDNFFELRQPGLIENLIENGLRAKFRPTDRLRQESNAVSNSTVKANTNLEKISAKELKDSEIKSALFKSSTGGMNVFMRVPDRENLKRYSIGRPLHTEIPMEAFIPVHYPSDPSRIIGGFAIVDQTGYFLTIESQRRFLDAQTNNYQAIQSTATGSTGANNSISSTLLAKAKQTLGGGNDHIPLTYLSEIFGNVVEENIIQRMKNGVYGMEMTLSRNNDVYSLMLARALAGMTTRLVYIPKQFFTYFAFQYNPNGTGRSLLTDVRYLISLRAVSLYAKVANQIRNAISVTDVSVELDPKDNDPQKSIEKIVDLVTQTRSQYFPWGLNTPSDIANWWQRAGFQMNIASHPRLMNTKVSYDFRNHDKGTPNIDDDETLNNMIHMHFGITPEMRDASIGADFATSVANNNILFSKRTQLLQQVYNDHLSNYCQVIVMNDAHVLGKIREIVREKWSVIVADMDDRQKTIAEATPDESIDFFTEEVVETIRAELPSPRVNRLTQQTEAFNAYVEALTAVFDAILTDDALTLSYFETTSEQIVQVVPHIKAQLIRDWMQRESYMTELFDLMNVGEKAEPGSEILDNIQPHLKNLAINVTNFIRKSMPMAVAANKDTTAALGGDEPTPSGGMLSGGSQPEET
jgi:hypothetical protein